MDHQQDNRYDILESAIDIGGFFFVKDMGVKSLFLNSCLYTLSEISPCIIRGGRL